VWEREIGRQRNEKSQKPGIVGAANCHIFTQHQDSACVGVRGRKRERKRENKRKRKTEQEKES